jgi:hypothetical protein
MVDVARVEVFKNFWVLKKNSRTIFFKCYHLKELYITLLCAKKLKSFTEEIFQTLSKNLQIGPI